MDRPGGGRIGREDVDHAGQVVPDQVGGHADQAGPADGEEGQAVLVIARPHTEGVGCAADQP